MLMIFLFFSSGNIPSIRLIMNCINAYELSSGKLVNRDKSLFLPVSKTSAQRINRWKRCTNFREKTFLLLILVAHCMLVRNMLEYFDYIVSKVGIVSFFVMGRGLRGGPLFWSRVFSNDFLFILTLLSPLSRVLLS